MTEITQADRDAAAPVFSAFGIDGEKIVKAGWADDDDTVKAFARHRLEERAKIVAWLRESPQFINSHGIADAIEQGEYLK